MKTHTKHWLILFLLLGTTVAVQAQYILGNAMTPEERQRNLTARSESWKSMREKRVGEVIVSAEEFKKGKPSRAMHLQSKQQLNPDGQLIGLETYGHKEKLDYKVSYIYDAQGHVTEQTSLTAKGKCYSKYLFQYSDELLRQSQTLRGPKQRLRNRIEYAYDATGRLTNSKFFRGTKGKLTSYSNYSYYEDGSKKRAENFNRRDKLVSVTDYACDQAGKVLAKDKVEERVVCERIEHDAQGQEYRVVETIDDNNGTERSVSKYNSRNYLVDFTRYDASGKVKVHWIYGYDVNGYLLTSERRTTGDKLETRSEYTRNELGLATTEVVTNGEGKILQKLAYSYNFY